MNAERLHAIALALKNDLEATNAEQLLRAIVKSLNAYVSNPQDAAQQQQLGERLSQLRTALQKAPYNDFSPGWKQLGGELAGVELFGLPLLERVDNIFQRNQITPAVAQKELTEIHKELSDFRGALDQLAAGLTALGIQHEQVEPGTVEVGVTIPRNEVDNEFHALGKEILEFDRIFKNFVEFGTRKREPVQVRSIASSDFNLLAFFHPDAINFFAAAVAHLIDLYKKLLEIREINERLRRIDVPEEKLEGIVDHANKYMEAGIESFLKELGKQYAANLDSGRRNEMQIAVKYSMKMLANRIDRGFNIDVRLGPPKERQGESDEEWTQLEAQRAAIQASSSTLRYIKEGGRPILQLPESMNEEGAGTAKPKRKQTKKKPPAKDSASS